MMLSDAKKLLFFFLLIVASTTAGASSTESVTKQKGLQKPMLIPFGTREVKRCAQLGSGSQSCGWSFQLDPTRCEDRGCSELVIYFSGGGMTCPTPQKDSYLSHYARKGYVAVCARAHENFTGSGTFPYHQEATRVEMLVKSITRDPIVQKAWNGKHLLFSGISHGATAPVIAMARTTYDNAKHWKGTALTAACFIDGIYDIHALFSFVKTNRCGPLRSILPYKRAFSRYCPWSGRQMPAKWPTPSACITVDTIKDTVSRSPASAFAIRHWKLIECGSQLAPCPKDVTPAAPVRALCRSIDAGRGHSCTYEQFPSLSHVQCGRMDTAAKSCQVWFESLFEGEA